MDLPRDYYRRESSSGGDYFKIRSAKDGCLEQRNQLSMPTRGGCAFGSRYRPTRAQVLYCVVGEMDAGKAGDD